MKRILSTAILLLCIGMLIAQMHIDEGFEGITSLPDGWSVFDDGDGLMWRNLEHANAHSGSRAAFVDNYLPNVNADWLITPQISVNMGDNLKFFSRAWYGTENLEVYVSTTLPQPGAFNAQLLNLQGLTNTYQEAEISLNDYAGMDIYIGFFWECTNYGILLDDVQIGQIEVLDPQLNLPESISFFSSESYEMDFSQYVVSSDISLASISCAENENIDVQIADFAVTFSAADYVGEEALIFTLDDAISGLIAIDTLNVIVLANPAVDFYVTDVLSPRDTEYLNIPIIPALTIHNGGELAFNDLITVDLRIYSPEEILLYSDTISQVMDLPASGNGELNFNSGYSPLQEEQLRFEFEITTIDSYTDNNSYEMLVDIVHRFTSGGPDTFGYSYLDSNDPLGPEYDWIEISETGTSSIMYGVPAFSGDDNFSEAIPLGFEFPFYGIDYSTAYIDINGELLFANNSWHSPYPDDGWDNDGNMFNYMYPIPGYTQMPSLVAVYWDDLEADEGIGDIYFQTFGTEPNRYTVIQWNDIRFRAGSDPQDLLKFQLILYESGELKMQYHTVATGQTGATIPHDFGASSTIGIQNLAANTGLSYLREIVQNNTYIGVEPAGNLLHDNLAILFYSGEDEQAPILTHDAVGNTFSQQMELVANIIDLSTPLEATLHYNLGSGWQEMAVTSTSANDYFFNLSDLPLGTEVQYYFSALDAASNSATLPEDAPQQYYSFKVLPTAEAKVLIAYSGTQDYNHRELPIYENIFTAMGIEYDIYDWEEYENYNIPSSYEGIVAYANTGSANEKMQYFASQLIQYLDAGTDAEPRNLWFSSDGLAPNQHAHPNSSNIRRLMSGYFRSSYVPTGLGGGSNGLAGPDSFSYEEGTILALPGTPVGVVDEEYPVFANSPDCIFPNDAAGDPYFDEVPYPEIGAIYIYAFEDGPINGQAYLYHGVAATAVETPSFKTLYFSFDFSQLTNPNHRNEWMQDLVEWWGINPISNEDPVVPEISTGISKVYPNPFNPTTNIMYRLDQSAPVSLDIFNLKGQKVKELVNDNKGAGIHTVAWNGKDSNNNAVASGIYYVRLKTTGFSQTRKITMIK